MFKNFTYFSKTNIGALIGAAGLYLRATGKGDVADTADVVVAQLPELMTALGAFLTAIGIGHKMDKGGA